MLNFGSGPLCANKLQNNDVWWSEATELRTRAGGYFTNEKVGDLVDSMYKMIERVDKAGLKRSKEDHRLYEDLKTDFSLMRGEFEECRKLYNKLATDVSGPHNNRLNNLQQWPSEAREQQSEMQAHIYALQDVTDALQADLCAADGFSRSLSRTVEQTKTELDNLKFDFRRQGSAANLTSDFKNEVISQFQTIHSDLHTQYEELHDLNSQYEELHEQQQRQEAKVQALQNTFDAVCVDTQSFQSTATNYQGSNLAKYANETRQCAYDSICQLIEDPHWKITDLLSKMIKDVSHEYFAELEAVRSELSAVKMKDERTSDMQHAVRRDLNRGLEMLQCSWEDRLAEVWKETHRVLGKLQKTMELLDKKISHTQKICYYRDEELMLAVTRTDDMQKELWHELRKELQKKLKAVQVNVSRLMLDHMKNNVENEEFLTKENDQNALRYDEGFATVCSTNRLSRGGPEMHKSSCEARELLKLEGHIEDIIPQHKGDSDALWQILEELDVCAMHDKLPMIQKNDARWDSTGIYDEAKHQQEELFLRAEDLHLDVEEVHSKLNATSADASLEFLQRDRPGVENFPVPEDPGSQSWTSTISVETISCNDGEPCPSHVGIHNVVMKGMTDTSVKPFQNRLEFVHEELNRGLKFSSDQTNILFESSDSFTSTTNQGTELTQNHMQADRCHLHDSFRIPSPEPAPKCVLSSMGELQSSEAWRPCIMWKDACESPARWVGPSRLSLTRQTSSPLIQFGFGCGSGMVQAH